MSDSQGFCVSCGHGLRPGTAFCEKCGAAVPPGVSVTAKPPILPPTSPKGSQAQQTPGRVEASPPSSPAGGSWLLPLVGLALVMVLMGVGIKLLKTPSAANSLSSQATSKTLESPQPDLVEASPETPPSQQPSQAEVTAQAPLSPQSFETAEEVPEPAEEEIPGIERIPLDRAESYLPYPRSRYKHYLKYPDGDEGYREMVVAVSDDNRVTTVLEFTHSRLYPDDPPGLWVNHYVTRPDGVYRYSDDDPDRAELWLPNDLALGKTWSNVLGEFEVVGFDESLTVNGIPFKGVLAYRHRSSVTEVDQTIWLGTGYGEIQGRYGEKGEEFCRLLKVESEPPERLDELMKRHVVNLDKVR